MYSTKYLLGISPSLSSSTFVAIIPPLRAARIGHRTDSNSYKETVFTTVSAVPGD
jgi:hypothetical protein